MRLASLTTHQGRSAGPPRSLIARLGRCIHCAAHRSVPNYFVQRPRPGLAAVTKMSAVAAMQQRAPFRAAQAAPRSNSIRVTAPQRQLVAPRLEGERACLPASGSPFSSAPTAYEGLIAPMRRRIVSRPCCCCTATVCLAYRPPALRTLPHRTPRLGHVFFHKLQS